MCQERNDDNGDQGGVGSLPVGLGKTPWSSLYTTVQYYNSSEATGTRASGQSALEGSKVAKL